MIKNIRGAQPTPSYPSPCLFQQVNCVYLMGKRQNVWEFSRGIQRRSSLGYYCIVQIDDGLSFFLPKHQINFRRDFSSSMFKGRIRTWQFKRFIRGILSFPIILLTLHMFCPQSPKSLQNKKQSSLKSLDKLQSNNTKDNVQKCPQCNVHIWWDFLICQNYSHQARQHRLKHSFIQELPVW